MKARDVIRLLEDDGWIRVSQKGSHRHFKHPTKPGKVTVPGKLSDDLPIGTLNPSASCISGSGPSTCDCERTMLAALDPNDTIAAVASPPGPAARGIVRLSGPEAWPIVLGSFLPARERPPPRRPEIRQGSL